MTVADDEASNARWNALFAGRTEWIKVREFMTSVTVGVRGDTMLWAELRDLMQRAAREGLPYDRGADGKGFKWPMQRCGEDLGHLKMDQGVDQHRIYFAAPEETGYESNLLALFYGLKLATDLNWKALQNDHIDTAEAAYQEWRGEVASRLLDT
ncbi:MAG: hypothetical protein WBA00_17185 [Rhodococcus sp. (in: high G+C Gram-positive bacteria)]